MGLALSISALMIFTLSVNKSISVILCSDIGSILLWRNLIFGLNNEKWVVLIVELLVGTSETGLEAIISPWVMVGYHAKQGGC